MEGGRSDSNGEAVAGFVCSIVSIGLLVVSVGFSSVISIVLGVIGIVYSGRGKRNVEEGRSSAHRELAQAGWVVGIVTTSLSVVATLFWVAIFVIAAAAPDWIDDDAGDPYYDDFQFQVILRAGLAAVRLIG